jgi:hypothetical protein
MSDSPGRASGSSRTVEIEYSSSARSADVFGPHERTVPRTKQEFRIHERSEERVTRRTVEAPQALRLGSRQPQSWHFGVFPTNPPQGIIL